MGDPNERVAFERLEGDSNRVRKLRIPEPRFLGDSLRTWAFHPVELNDGSACVRPSDTRKPSSWADHDALADGGETNKQQTKQASKKKHRNIQQ